MEQAMAYVCCPAEESRVKVQRYCRKIYELGYVPICPRFGFLPFLDEGEAEDLQAYNRMSHLILKRCRMVVVCGKEVTGTMNTDISTADRLHIICTTFDKCFTLPEQLINEGTGMDCTGTISVITDKDKFDTIETSLNQLIDKNSDLVMDTIEESVNYYNRNQQLVFGAFLIVAIIVVCFSLINLVNTTITNFLSRKREIGMLQAIGLSKKQLIRMLCYEGMIYSLFAVLVTLILGVGFGILCIQIMRSLNPYFFYSFPWPVVLIYSAVLLAVQLILIAYTTGNLKKQSLVDQIKTME